jgi:hypothetical protein
MGGASRPGFENFLDLREKIFLMKYPVGHCPAADRVLSSSREKAIKRMKTNLHTTRTWTSPLGRCTQLRPVTRNRTSIRVRVRRTNLLQTRASLIDTGTGTGVQGKAIYYVYVQNTSTHTPYATTHVRLYLCPDLPLQH